MASDLLLLLVVHGQGREEATHLVIGNLRATSTPDDDFFHILRMLNMNNYKN